jgi:hypothetical protein
MKKYEVNDKIIDEGVKEYNRITDKARRNKNNDKFDLKKNREELEMIKKTYLIKKEVPVRKETELEKLRRENKTLKENIEEKDRKLRESEEKSERELNKVKQQVEETNIKLKESEAKVFALKEKDANMTLVDLQLRFEQQLNIERREKGLLPPVVPLDIEDSY